MIRTIDEILEQAEEKRITQQFDDTITKMLQPDAWKLEEVSPEELEKRQKQWDEALAAGNFKSLLIPKSEVVGCSLIRPSKCWGISSKLENLYLTNL